MKQLDQMGVLDDKVHALDTTFIEAYSRRDQEDNCLGLSDYPFRIDSLN